MKTVFHVVEILASSPLFLFICGCGLTIVPFAGIMIIHNKKNSDGKSTH